MQSNILEVIKGFPPRIQELHNSAFALAFDEDELKLQFIDSSAFLLAIIKLGDTNASARWLHSIGLTDTAIARFIAKDFSRREEARKIWVGKGKKQQVSAIANYTQAANKMFEALGLIGQGRRVADAVYISNALEAIVLSGSETVERIFDSVGLTLADVRHKLEIPTYFELSARLA